VSARRFDSSKLGKVEKTSHGFLKIPANFTRVGVLEYRDGQGNITRELRHPDHVFAPESLATLAEVPVTDLHPSEFVTPDNVAKLAVGFVSGQPTVEGNFVSGKVVIQRQDTIEAVLSGGRKEISLGYTCVPVIDPGVWEGQSYDVVQTHIKYDHAAIGPDGWGRAGSDVALRLDGGAFCVLESEKNDMDETQLKAAVARADAAEARIATIEAELGKAQARADELAKALNTYQAAEKVAARSALEDRARKVVGADVRFDGKSDREVREAAILKLQPEKPLTGLSDEFVAGAFEYLTGSLPQGRNDSLANLHKVVSAPTTDAPKTMSEIRADAITARNNRWKLNGDTK
jgi:hypothetical protein